MTSFTTRIANSDYKNWLKAGLGLVYVKDGLTNFIDAEVKSFHNDILKNVQTGAAGGAISPCNSCTPRDIRYNAKSKNWSISCANHVCDAILSYILAEHNIPASRSIHWRNCSIGDWTQDYWELAKAFMNQGQTAHNKGPRDCDVSALLNLMINCKRFHGNISTKTAENVRTDRNKVMHSEDMHVTDMELKNWLTDMSDLLKSMKNYLNHPETVAALQHIDEVENTDFEVTASHELKVVNEKLQALGQKVLESGTLIDQLDKQTKERLTRAEVDLFNLGQKMDKDLELLESKLLDRQDSRLEKLKEETKLLLQSKYQDGFVATKQFVEANKCLLEKGSIVVTGKPGEGKTTSCVILMTANAAPDRCVILRSSKDWDTIQFDKVDIVCIDDIFGMYQFDQGKFGEWSALFETIQACIDRGKIKVIISSRSNVLAECEAKVKKIELFRHRTEFSSDRLSFEEKKLILSNSLRRANKSLSPEEMQKCLKTHDCPIGFPYCCALFAADELLFEQKHNFFRKPFEFFIENIEALDKTKFLSLVCLFVYGGNIPEHTFKDDSRMKALKAILPDMMESIDMESGVPTAGKIEASLQQMLGSYVDISAGRYIFTHNTIGETIGLLYGRRNPTAVIRSCSPDFLFQCIDIDTSSSSTNFLHISPGTAYEELAIRLIDEIIDNKHIRQASRHPSLLSREFVEVFSDQLQRLGKMVDFLKARELAGHILKLQFFPEAMMTTNPAIRPVAEMCINFLTCGHDFSCKSDVETCWKCEQKQRALRNSFQNEDDEIPSLLLDSGAIASMDCLWDCVVGGNIDLVRRVVDQLRAMKQWNPKHLFAAFALKYLYRSGKKELADLLANEGAETNMTCLLETVQSGNVALVSDVIEVLKRKQLWDPSHPMVTRSLQKSYKKGTIVISEVLIAEGVTVNIEYLGDAVKSGKLTVVEDVIRQLEETNQWEPGDQNVRGALELAYVRGHRTIADLLIAKEAVTTPDIFYNQVKSGEADAVKNAIKRLRGMNMWEQGNDVVCRALASYWAADRKDLVNILVEEGVVVDHSLLMKAVQADDRTYLKNVIDLLGDWKLWNPADDEIHQILHMAIVEDFTNIADMLISSGVKMLPCCLEKALESKRAALLEIVIQTLRLSGHWNTESDVHQALHMSFQKSENDIWQTLIDAGAILSSCCLYEIVKYRSAKEVETVVKKMKESNQLDPNAIHDIHHDSLYNQLIYHQSYNTRKKYENISVVLITEGVEVRPCCIEHVISMLNDTDVHVNEKEDIVYFLVKELIIRMTECGSWDPQNETIHAVLHQVIKGNYIQIRVTLLSSGIVPKACCINDVIRYCKEYVLHDFLLARISVEDGENEKLIKCLEATCDKKDDVRFLMLAAAGVLPLFNKIISGDNNDVRTVLAESNVGSLRKSGLLQVALMGCFMVGDTDKAELCLQTGAKVTPRCAIAAVLSWDSSPVSHVITKLQKKGKLDQTNKELVVALELAYLLGNDAVVEAFEDSGVKPTVKMDKYDSLWEDIDKESFATENKDLIEILYPPFDKDTQELIEAGFAELVSGTGMKKGLQKKKSESRTKTVKKFIAKKLGFKGSSKSPVKKSDVFDGKDDAIVLEDPVLTGWDKALLRAFVLTKEKRSWDPLNTYFDNLL